MTTWFVTRHRGAVQWAANQGIQVTGMGIIEDLDPRKCSLETPSLARCRSILLGSSRAALNIFILPWSCLSQPAGGNSPPTTCAAMAHALNVTTFTSPAVPTRIDGAADESVMVVIASGQTIPNLLPLLALGQQAESPVSGGEWLR